MFFVIHIIDCVEWNRFDCLGNLTLVQALVSDGVNVNARAFNTKWTPLHFAAENGKLIFNKNTLIKIQLN